MPKPGDEELSNVDRPNIDVVIPLYNKAPFVEQAVRSALNQTLPPVAVYVADDASTDGGADLVARLAETDNRVRLLRSSDGRPHGPGSARNRAVAGGTSKLIAFLDADDFWEDGKLDAQARLFADDGVGIVHCGAREIDASGGLIGEFHPLPVPRRDLLFDAVRLGRHAVGSPSVVMTRRHLLAAAGPFLEGMTFIEDWDMWSRLVSLSGLGRAPQLLANIRHLPTLSRAGRPADRFATWLTAFDRWQSDERFMRRAVAEARGMAGWHQLRMILEPGRMLFGFPREIAASGGAVGRRLYGSPRARAITFATILPAMAQRALWKAGARLNPVRRFAKQDVRQR